MKVEIHIQPASSHLYMYTFLINQSILATGKYQPFSQCFVVSKSLWRNCGRGGSKGKIFDTYLRKMFFIVMTVGVGL